MEFFENSDLNSGRQISRIWSLFLNLKIVRTLSTSYYIAVSAKGGWRIIIINNGFWPPVFCCCCSWNHIADGSAQACRNLGGRGVASAPPPPFFFSEIGAKTFQLNGLLILLGPPLQIFRPSYGPAVVHKNGPKKCNSLVVEILHQFSRWANSAINNSSFVRGKKCNFLISSSSNWS